MILDSHAYCFAGADSLLGYDSVAHHMGLMQRVHAHHHQPAFRIRDRGAGPSEVLAAPPDEPSRLPDCNFRLDKEAGRVLWDHAGETYTKHFYPPNLRNLEFTPHSLIGEMDYAGIDRALLHTDDSLGRSNAYQADCVRRYPDRLLSMASIDVGSITADVDRVVADLTVAIDGFGLHAIKFGPDAGYAVTDEPWDGPSYRPFWDAVSQLGVPVFLTLGTGPRRLAQVEPDRDAQRGYVEELGVLDRLLERYPTLVCSLTHGFPYRLYLADDTITLPEELWRPFAHPNLSIEICFPIRIGDVFDYPYQEVWPALEQMVSRIGPDRLLYGTDMPFQNRFCTYQQSRRWLEAHFAPAVGLSAGDLGAIMGDTACRILGLESAEQD